MLVQAVSWLLLGLLTANIVVLGGWLLHGAALDASALLPRLSDPRLWAVSALLALSITEPWRALALIATLGLDELPHTSEPESSEVAP
jgi:hypothetical protein